MKELVGWGSACVVLPTFGLQAYKQWKERDQHAPATTLWFFILALVGCAGQIAYSWMIGNWVYFVINVFLLVTDAFGLAIVIYRRRSSSPQSVGTG